MYTKFHDDKFMLSKVVRKGNAYRHTHTEREREREREKGGYISLTLLFK
jgi:hypothetical protein